MKKQLKVMVLAVFVILTAVSSSGSNSGTAKEGYMINSIGMKFKLIEAGTFKRGCKDGGPLKMSKPVHKVTLTYDFYMGVYLVTQEQYEAVMGENPSHFRGPNLPVESIPYIKAEEFCKKLSEKEGVTYRLPYDAEWEYACRAGTKTKFFWGNDIDWADEYGWHEGNSGRKTHPVGEKKPNNWGIYDMCGNVSEMIQDNFGLYQDEHLIDPKGPTEPWGLLDGTLRSSDYETGRECFNPCYRHGTVKGPYRGKEAHKSPGIGFRVVREISD